MGKGGGQYHEPPLEEPAPGEPGSDAHYEKWLEGKDFPSQSAADDAYWQEMGASDKAAQQEFLDKHTHDFEVQADMSLEPVKEYPGWTGKTPHPDELKLWHEMTPEEQADFMKKADAEAHSMNIEDTLPPPKAQDALDKLHDAIKEKFPDDFEQDKYGIGPGGDFSALPPEFLDPNSPDFPGPNRWDYRPPGMKKGKARVHKIGVKKGFGPRHAENAKEGDLTKINTDTVPAMLTPREAVLNRNAAELAGRDQIEALNEQGNRLAKQGVDLAARGDPDVQQGDRMSEESYRQMKEDEALAQRVLRRPDAKRKGPKGQQFDPGEGSPAGSNFWRQILGPMGGLQPEEELYPDFIKLRKQLSMDPMMAATGESNVPDPGAGERLAGPDANPGIRIFKQLQKLLPGLGGDPIEAGKEAYGDLKHLLKQFTPGRDEPEIPSLPKQVIEPHEPKWRSESFPARELEGRKTGISSWRDYMKFLQTAPPDEPGEASEDEPFLERLDKMRNDSDKDQRMVLDPFDPLPPSTYVPERPPERLKKGTKDMKPKQSKPKSGSPYAQGYEKLQGGGNVYDPRRMPRNPDPLAHIATNPGWRHWAATWRWRDGWEDRNHFRIRHREVQMPGMSLGCSRHIILIRRHRLGDVALSDASG